MSERSENSIQAASFVEELKATENLLGENKKDLAEIDPRVSHYVETDPDSVDFGRVKPGKLAEEMAYRHEEAREDELDKAGIGLWLKERAGLHLPQLTPETARAEADKAADARMTQLMAISCSRYLL